MLKKLLGISALAGMASACSMSDLPMEQAPLTVVSEPAGATAEFSDGQTCQTPCTVMVEGGQDIRVRIGKAGYRSEEKWMLASHLAEQEAMREAYLRSNRFAGDNRIASAANMPGSRAIDVRLAASTVSPQMASAEPTSIVAANSQGLEQMRGTGQNSDWSTQLAGGGTGIDSAPIVTTSRNKTTRETTDARIAALENKDTSSQEVISDATGAIPAPTASSQAEPIKTARASSQPSTAALAATTTDAPPVAAQPALGGFGVQLGSFRDATAAREEAQRLGKKFEGILSPLAIRVEDKDLGADKGLVYRVKFMGFSAMNEARTACSNLKAMGQSCIPTQ